MSEPKRHHVLPVSFQKLFSSNGKEKIWCLTQEKIFETNSSNVAVVSRHYEFSEDGKPQKWIESELSSQENKAINAIEKIKTAKSIKSVSHDKRKTITGFLKLAICRYIEFHDRTDPSKNKRLLNDIRTGFRDLFGMNHPCDSSDIFGEKFISEAYHASKKQSVLSDLPMVSKFLKRMRLSLIEAPKGFRFITGEHVCAIFHNSRSDTIIMPICPTLAVRWSRRDCSPLQRVDEDLVTRVNKQIFAMSEFSVASHEEDLTGLI